MTRKRYAHIYPVHFAVGELFDARALHTECMYQISLMNEIPRLAVGGRGREPCGFKPFVFNIADLQKRFSFELVYAVSQLFALGHTEGNYAHELKTAAFLNRKLFCR